MSLSAETKEVLHLLQQQQQTLINMNKSTSKRQKKIDHFDDVSQIIDFQNELPENIVDNNLDVRC